MSTPKLTILMPLYNAAPFISEAIDSVLSQSMTDFELLIVDDSSEDESVEIIKSYDDDRIRLLQRQHLGIDSTLNYGLTQSRSDIIARFDADDICFPQRLEQQYKFLSSNPEYVICGGNAEYIDARGDHLFYFDCKGYSNNEIHSKLHSHCPFIHSAVMYRKKEVLMAGGYSIHAHNFEDYLLWVRIAKFGLFANLKERLIKVRFNPQSVTIDEKWRGDTFRTLKGKIIRTGTITENEGQQLDAIIRSQDLRKLKESAYYALCGKKFLVDNHQPVKARRHLYKAIRTYPRRWDNYLLYMASYLPQSWIGWLHKKVNYQTQNR